MRNFKRIQLGTLALLIASLLVPGSEAEGRQRRVGKVREVMIEGGGADRKPERVEHFLEEEDGRGNVRLKRMKFRKKLQKRLRTGTEVELKEEGVRENGGGEIELDAPDSLKVISAPQASALAAPAPGSRRVAVLRVSTNSGAVTCSKSSLQNKFFGGLNSVDTGYNELSYGRVRLSGDVYEVSITGFDSKVCSWYNWESAARNAASGAGIDLNAYDHVYYEFPKTACALGLADLGGKNAAGFGSCDSVATALHELGHNLGMMHANTTQSGGQFENKEYGDVSDPMGNFWGIAGPTKVLHMNAPHKAFMGWITPKEVAVSGEHTLTSMAFPDAQVVVAAGAYDKYYISYRAPDLMDAYLPSTFKYRTSIHFLAQRGETQLIKTLGDGESYTNEYNGITIKQVSSNSMSAKVQIVRGGVQPPQPPQPPTVCTKAKPLVEFENHLQFGAPGRTIAYNAIVTNKDSAACPTTVFMMSVITRSGFKANTLSPVSLAPGASAKVQVLITAPTTYLQAGNYGFGVYAKDPLDSTHMGVNTLVYTLVNP